MERNKTRAALLGAVLLGSAMLTGCASQFGESMFVGEDEGRFLLSTDAAGMYAFGDSLHAIITEGKASPDIKSAAWQNADARVEVKKFRIMSAKAGKAGAK